MGASAPATRRAGRTHESRTWFFRRIRTHTVRTERSGDDAPIPWVLAGVEAPGEADVTAHPFKPFQRRNIQLQGPYRFLEDHSRK